MASMTRVVEKRATVSLDSMVRSLRDAYGDQLHAVILYGSAASAEPDPNRADYNLLVLVDQIELARIIRSSPAVLEWTAAGNPPPLIFTAREWGVSGDIYPMEYTDVLESHRVLFGNFEIGNVEIELSHLRLQLEQEAMGKLLWLRQGAAIAGANAQERAHLLEGSISKLLVICRGVLRLHGHQPPARKVDVITAAERAAGFNGASLLSVVNYVDQKKAVPAADSEALLAGTLAALEHLAAHINGFRPSARSYVAAWMGASNGENQK